MTRIFGQNAVPEMVGLWLIETAICFAVLRTVFAGMPLPDLDALLLALTLGLIGFALGLYRAESCAETRRLVVKTGVAGLLSLPALWLVAHLAGIDPAPFAHRALASGDPFWPLQMLLAWTALLLLTRLAYHAALRQNLFVRRVLVIGPPHPGGAAARTAAAIATPRRGLFRVEATLPALDDTVDGRRLWGAVIAGPPSTPGANPSAGPITGLRIVEAAAFWERQLGRVDLGAAEPLCAASPSLSAAALRRLMDIVLALALLLLTAPLMLLTALLIGLESSGPVFYRQERVGLGGVPFTLIKFRSMHADAERAGPAWAATRDPRATRVGAVIRKLRVDELPQLLNILRGEMSLVGPRPERPHFAASLASQIPLFAERTRVKPGLTGWAQVNYPYGASVEDARQKLSYDLYYVKHRSLLLDVVILLATVRVILFQEGAR